MTYPNVALKFDEYLPSIELNSAPGEFRTILVADKSLDTVLTEAAQAMGADWTIDEIMTRIKEADEFYIEFPEKVLDSEALDFNFIEEVLQQGKENYAEPEGVSAELAAEINNFWYADMLASILEHAYTLLIARTVLLASELGIGDIQLIDSRHDAHLREKMSRDLSTIDLELIVPDVIHTHDQEED